VVRYRCRGYMRGSEAIEAVGVAPGAEDIECQKRSVAVKLTVVDYVVLGTCQGMVRSAADDDVLRVGPTKKSLTIESLNPLQKGCTPSRGLVIGRCKFSCLGSRLPGKMIGWQADLRIGAYPSVEQRSNRA